MNILLCCDGGFSTSIVVAKMQEEAKKQGKDYEIWAINIGSIKDHIRKADVVLLGPHMVHKTNYAKDAADPLGVPVGIINGTDYSFGYGANVIKQAEELVKAK